MKKRSKITALVFAACFAACSTAGLSAEGLRIDSRQKSDWARNEIDRRIMLRQQAAGFQPAPLAARRTLIRRLSFDLLGLPPSPAEVGAFVRDRRPDATEQLIERLLASPHFGERMAQFWLDLARYADSDGYHDDTNRSMWLYRDYVIGAFNSNRPFDEFTIEQLAGDLLPNATREQIVATAFHRNGPTSSEDGANPDEYRSRYAVDRVNTTAQIWMGLTVQCAECHDHKYDPISMKEYYQLYAYFNQTPERPLFRGPHAPPSIGVPSEEQQRKLANVDARLANLRQASAQLTQRPAFERSFPRWRDIVIQQAELNRSLIARSDVICELLFDGQDKNQLKNTGARRRPATVRASTDGATLESCEGFVGEAFRFRGGGAALDLGQIVEFRQLLPFTFEAWVRPATGGVVVGKVDPANASRGLDIRLVDGRLSVRLIDWWPTAAIEVTTVSHVRSQQWHHISVTWDGRPVPDAFHVYINGQAQDLSVTANGAVERIRNRAPLIIGGSNTPDKSFDGDLDAVRFYKWPLSAALLEQLLFNAIDPKLDEHREWMRQHYVDYVDPAGKELSEKRAALRRQRQELTNAIPRLRVMQEIPERRPTFVLRRGDFRSPGEAVEPGTLSMLAPMRENRGDTRLALARWLTEENDRHTARVFANRLWAMLFGRGLVTTLDDFGIRGELATHPELLDWLGDEFIRSGWDVKAMIRLIVSSATYQQSSDVDAESPASADGDRDRSQSERDQRAENLYVRNRRLRLPAEFLRDNALKISGLLSHRVGGPSVRPYQPEGLWREMSKGDEPGKAYQQSHGASLYRRGVYTFWKRSIHYPAFAVMDAPSREVCTSRRPVTNTPVQALAMLNDPTFVEAARVFAQHVVASRGEDVERLEWAFLQALGRKPLPREVETLQSILKQTKDAFRLAAQSTTELLAVGEAPLPTGIDKAQLAAWTAITQILLTLDETITRE